MLYAIFTKNLLFWSFRQFLSPLDNIYNEFVRKLKKTMSTLS